MLPRPRDDPLELSSGHCKYCIFIFCFANTTVKKFFKTEIDLWVNFFLALQNLKFFLKNQLSKRKKISSENEFTRQSFTAKLSKWIHKSKLYCKTYEIQLTHGIHSVLYVSFAQIPKFLEAAVEIEKFITALQASSILREIPPFIRMTKICCPLRFI